MKPQEKISRVIGIFCLISLLLVLFLFAFTFFSTDSVRSDSHQEISFSNSLTPLNEGWYLLHDDGSKTSASLPLTVEVTDHSPITLVYELDENTGNQSLLFDNHRLEIVIATEQGELYRVGASRVSSYIHFTDYQIVSLPAEGAKQIRITLSSSISDTYQFPVVYMGDYASVRMAVLESETCTIVLLIILAFFALIIIICFIVSLTRKRLDSRLLSLFFFLILTATWAVCDSNLPAVFPIPQEIIGLGCYLSLALLPYPLIYFGVKSMKHHHPVLTLSFLLPCINLCLQCILAFFGLLQLQKAIYFSFLIAFIITVISLYFCYREWKEKKEDWHRLLLFLSAILLIAFTLIAIVIYLFDSTFPYRNIFLFGDLFFLIMLFTEVVIQIFQLWKENQEHLAEMEAYERYSLIDGLTDLKNRRAYEMKMHDLEKALRPDQDAVLYMMDINGLKQTNDTFGHTSGDDLIVASAGIIQSVFGSVGECYRIGGDEFVVLATSLPIDEERLQLDLSRKISLENTMHPWKISIAVGCSHILHSNGQRLTISDWKQEADTSMYRDKRIKKGELPGEIEKKDLETIIRCIVNSMEARDAYTAQHSERVRALSLCIADHLGVSDSTRKIIEIAAQLHDIGKIGIPDSILLKPGRLTDEEFEVIKKHPVIGAKIIEQAHGMLDVAQAVLSHHERYDGKGYPYGFKNDEIPLESRIIAIADSIDAMTSHRVYRSTFTLDYCREEIQRGSGNRYDPVIVQVTLQHWEDIEAIVLMHPNQLSW